MKIRRFILISLVVIAALLATIHFGANFVYAAYLDKTTEVVEKPNTEVITNNIDITLIEPTDEEESTEIVIEETTKDSIYTEEQKEDNIVNIVVCGMDARNPKYNSRSDAIVLASYNKDTNSVKISSFLRDSYVYIPEHGWGRINAATAYGGPGLLINTLNYNFGLDIQHYVEIKFNGFKSIVDILGGIDVELSKSEIEYINYKLHTEDQDYSNDITSAPGVVYLNGAQTLWHCRNRSIGEGDFSRVGRQQEIIELLANKITSASITEIAELISVMGDYVNTNIELGMLLDLATNAITSGDLQIESLTIPMEGYYKYSTINGASVLEIDIENTTKYLAEFVGYTD